MIKGTDLTQTVKMNELFSPAGLASQVLWSEVSNKLKAFVGMTENLTGYSVKALRSDLESRYVSKDFLQYCKVLGRTILHLNIRMSQSR